MHTKRTTPFCFFLLCVFGLLNPAWAQAPNDDLAAATLVTEPLPYTNLSDPGFGLNSVEVDEVLASCVMADPIFSLWSVWWRYTPTETDTYTIETPPNLESGRSLSLWTGVGTHPLTAELACGTVDMTGTITLAHIPLDAGTTYWIRAGVKAAAFLPSEPVELRVRTGNDNLAEAIAVAGLPASFSADPNEGGTELGEAEATCAATGTTGSVWYSYTAPPAGEELEIDIAGPDDYVLSVHTGSDHPLDEVGCTPFPGTSDCVCADDNPAGSGETISAFAAAGSTTYLIRAAVKPGPPAGRKSHLFAPFTLTFDVDLPVELARFEAHREGGDVVLSWETATEQDNAGFEVQVKSDVVGTWHTMSQHGAPQYHVDRSWETVAYVDGAGTTSAPQSYTHRIPDLHPGTYRFRLKQLDFDGAFAYSSEVAVTVAVPGAYVFEPAYPNPFGPGTPSTLRFAVAREQAVQAVLYTVLGQPVRHLFAGRAEANRMHTLHIEAGTLAAGLYLVRLTGETFADLTTLVVTQ